mmetsp:Transcript_2227/g.6502  ORF Transcript_2227/g.6502 Transcript_2227/m.6502 type:complete len:212 (+) Transcript_2227:1228-1863(+)
MIDHRLTKGKDTEEAQILLRLDGVKMVGALGDAKLLTEGRFVHLVDTDLKQLLCSGVVHDVLGAIIDVSVDDGDEESTLGGRFKEGEALGDARLKKDDGVLEKGLGLVGGNGIGNNLGGDNLVMFHFISVVVERSIAKCGDGSLFLDELLGGNLVTEEGLVLEGLEILPLLDGHGRTGQLDWLGGRLDHGVRVGVVAAVMRGHGCVCVGRR